MMKSGKMIQQENFINLFRPKLSIKDIEFRCDIIGFQTKELLAIIGEARWDWILQLLIKSRIVWWDIAES